MNFFSLKNMTWVILSGTANLVTQDLSFNSYNCCENGWMFRKVGSSLNFVVYVNVFLCKCVCTVCGWVSMWLCDCCIFPLRQSSLHCSALILQHPRHWSHEWHLNEKCRHEALWGKRWILGQYLLICRGIRIMVSNLECTDGWMVQLTHTHTHQLTPTLLKLYIILVTLGAAKCDYKPSKFVSNRYHAFICYDGGVGGKHW